MDNKPITINTTMILSMKDITWLKRRMRGKLDERGKAILEAWCLLTPEYKELKEAKTKKILTATHRHNIALSREGKHYPKEEQ